MIIHLKSLVSAPHEGDNDQSVAAAIALVTNVLVVEALVSRYAHVQLSAVIACLKQCPVTLLGTVVSP
jgi:hypothetical protein